mgnify:CR=1 FL=1
MKNPNLGSPLDGLFEVPVTCKDGITRKITGVKKISANYWMRVEDNKNKPIKEGGIIVGYEKTTVREDVEFFSYQYTIRKKANATNIWMEDRWLESPALCTEFEKLMKEGTVT